MKLISKKEDMRDLFTIQKGQYKKDNSPDDICVSGYDPNNSNTNEWYQVCDTVVWYTFYAGSSYAKALEAVKRCIKQFRDREEYFKYVCEITSEDYYGVHYLHQAPLSDDSRASKACDGRCPRTSPSTKALRQKIYDTYGEFYRDALVEIEDEAYEELKRDTLLNNTSKKLIKRKSESTTPTEEKPKKLFKTKKEVKEVEERVTLKKPLMLKKINR